MPIRRPTRDEAVVTLKQYYQTLVPGFDVQTEGSPEEDIFIKAPVYGAIGRIWDSIAEISRLQTLEDAQLLSVEELDGLLETNQGFERKSSTKSRGFVTLATSNLSSDIFIPDGALVATLSGIQFSIIGSYTMFSVIASSYFDSATQRYVLTVPIVARDGGVIGNVKSKQIVQLLTSIPGIDFITNPVPTAGGAETETNVDYVNRYRERLRGTDYTSYGGMLRIVDDPENQFGAVQDRLLIKAGDPLMTRDEGLGGMVDIYILGESLFTVSQRIVYHDSVNSSTGYLQLVECPVALVNSVASEVIQTTTGTTQIIYSDAVLVKDTTSEYSGSIYSQDKIKFDPNNKPVDGDVIIVNYTYNKLIKDIQGFFNIDRNRAPNSDVLIREAKLVQVTIGATVSIDQSLTFNEIAQEAIDAIESFVDRSLLGEGFTKFDIVNILDDVDGITNVSLNQVIIDSEDEIIDENGDVVVPSTSYVRVQRDEEGRPLITIQSSINS